MIIMCNEWSDELIRILTEKDLNGVFIEKYQLPPQERYTVRDLLEEFGEYILPQLKAHFENTNFKLLYTDEEADDFLINVCMRALNSMGATSSIFYSDEESSIVISMTEKGFSAEEIATLIGRTVEAIYSFRIRYELTPKWTDEEDELLKRLFANGHSDKEISDLMANKNENQVRYRRMQLKLLRRKSFTKVDLTTKNSIKESLRNGLTPKEITKALGFPLRFVNSQIELLGLTNEKLDNGVMKK